MSSQLNRDSEKLEAKETTLLDRIFRDSEGKIVLAQMPNLPLLVGLAGTLLQLILPSGKTQAGVDLVAFGALFTWAWQELFEGVNYFRRALGFIVLVGMIALRLNLSTSVNP
ncbi:MAG: hypothetical protein JOZ78_23365 [Chroococcidiopsidaceae cyanobacterium CP_BM_ER_R8_30]|nr:hypothetical protein [Chroococcidiopsidaceae cyanobacterium CP_BM_ER_R8_30]